MIKTCVRCGKKFSVREKRSNTAKFCSIECRKVPSVICTVCGNAFHPHTEGRLDTAKYCSRKCKGIASRHYRTCSHCGKVFYGFNAGIEYCSRKCSADRRRAHEKRDCVVCGSTFYPKPASQKCCSVGCANTYMGRNKLSYKCEECGQPFKWSPSRIKNNNPRFCTIKCRNRAWERDGWKMLRTIQAKQQLHNPTKLELLGYSLLDEMDVEYVKQFEVKEKFLVDAFIPSTKTVIQFDGDYWHGNTKTYPTLTERQINQQKKDRAQDAYLKKCGYRIVRVWESDLKRDPHALQKLLRDMNV